MKYRMICMLTAGVVVMICMGCGGKPSESVVSSVKEAAKEKVTQKVTEKAVEKAIESNLSTKDQKVDVDLDSGGDAMTMTVTGEDGKTRMVMGPNAKIPPNFPKDVPQYPGMTLSQLIVAEENETFTLEASTKDPLEKVTAYFKEEAAKNGWTEEMAMNQTGETPMAALNYSKESRILNLILTTGEGETRITLNTAKQ